MSGASLIVIAKAPVAGRSKTRLCPPCTPVEASELAAAALADTLAAVARTPCARRVVALDGDPGDWLPPGVDVIAQRGDGLADRLGAAFADVGGPAFLIAMDTPQVTPSLLAQALASLAGADAALGRTDDGGYWGIGQTRPDRRVFERVPMSTSITAEIQARRLRELGRRCATLPQLRDVDTIADARAVAAMAPRTRFAGVLRALGHAPDDEQAVAVSAA
jgi:hypothetical protein